MLDLPKLVGIVNVTPDSFSDGGKFLDSSAALKHCYELLDSGAAFVELGADSTRPGSECVGIEEELGRLKPVVDNLKDLPFGVDTHHFETARYALESGARFINDITGGKDPRILSLMAEYPDSKIVLMYLPSESPHVFSENAPENCTPNYIKSKLKLLIEKTLSAGVKKEQIILDSGMGAFLSPNPTDSLKLLSSYGSLSDLEYPLFLGISRKGFISKEAESESQKDFRSALMVLLVLQSCDWREPRYIRAHNISLHMEILRESRWSELLLKSLISQ